jgi:hypothetical protein
MALLDQSGGKQTQWRDQIEIAANSGLAPDFKLSAINRMAVDRRRLHFVWRPGARDTVCGIDVFQRYLAAAPSRVTCPACLRIIGIATMLVGPQPTEST